MPITVEGPGGYQVEFPDGTAPETMRDAMRKHFGFQEGSVAPEKAGDAFDAARDAAWQAPQGFNRGVDSVINAPYSAVRAIAGLLGYELPEAQPIVGQLNSGVAPEGTAGRVAGVIGEAAGANALPALGIAGTATRSAATALPAVEGGLARTVGHKVAEGVRAAPGAAAAADVASAVGQGTGASIARENELGPDAETLLATAGGLAPALAPAAKALVRSATAEAAPKAAQPRADAPEPVETPAQPAPKPAVIDAAPEGAAVYDAKGRVSHRIDAAGNRSEVEIPASLREPPVKEPSSFAPLVEERPATVATPDREAVAEASARTGVSVPDAAVGGPVKQRVAGALASTPLIGGPLQKAAQKSMQELGTIASETARKFGNPGAYTAGNAASSAMRDWIKGESADTLKAIYEGVEATFDQAVTREITTTRGLVKKLTDDAVVSTSKTNEPVIAIVEEALSKPGGMSYQGLKQLRADVGARLEAAKITPEPGTNIPAMKQLYGTLSQDLRAVVYKAGGEKALRSFDKANAIAETVAKQRKELSKIVGVRGTDPNSSEAVMETILGMASSKKSANLSRLSLAKKTMGADAWGDVAGEATSRLGVDPATNQFSAGRFLTSYGKLSENGKAILFGDRADLKQSLDDIATISTKFRELERLGNTSNTGGVNTILTFIAAPMAWAAPKTLIGAAAARGVSSLLARPVVAKNASRWAKSYYAATRNPTAAATAGLGNATRALAAVLAEETGEDPKAVEAKLKQAMEQTQ